MNKKATIVIPSPLEHPLKARLRAYKLTTWQLAELCGVSRSYLAQMLCGTAPMTQEIKQKLEDLLDQLEVENG